MAIEDILAERQKTHGPFAKTAYLSQFQRTFLREQHTWEELSYEQQEALDMIVHKIARILSGNPDEIDHWNDIAGYATLGGRASHGETETFSDDQQNN